MNQAALADDEQRQTGESDSRKWQFGSRVRERGSLHSDVFLCTGAELAECNLLGIYPRSGWWKDQPNRARSPEAAIHYALVVSIDTEAQNVDICTPVYQILKVPAAEILDEAV